ncbi:odorant receptor 13a-like [Formica exsecta]|uniref:odorant receptor 13a-like n=1 Tax=Formica exsecta TaxID=72781 RepID=UPI0011420997|nr:odorant receptor 13a-like [Formica exsecta]
MWYFHVTFYSSAETSIRPSFWKMKREMLLTVRRRRRKVLSIPLKNYYIISLRIMKSVWNYYYSMTKRMLLLVGQWPYQRRKERLLRVTVMTMISLSMIVPQIGKFIQCDRDVQCILTTIPTHLFQIVVIVKLYACQFNNSKIKELTDQVYSDWENLEIPEEYEIMKTYAAKARLFSLIYTSYYAIAAPLFILITLTPQILDIVLPLNESRPILLPYEAHYFVHDDTEYFFYIFFHALVGIIIVCVGLLAHDCLILTYIEHVCSIFAVAGFRFENLACSENIDMPNNNLENIYNQKIALSIHTHWRALQFAELLADTFSITFIIQILIITVTMSVTLLKIAGQSNDNMEVARYIAYVVGQLIHLFCFSLQGQRLIDHSLQIRDKIYNGFWYKIPVKSQRMLLHVMRKCLQPNFLTAGKIYIFSLKSFTTVLQSSMSYFTVLASFE